jgi:large subunit ribosomal protein L7/L12
MESAAAAPVEAAPKKEIFDLKLKAVDAKAKLKVIKEVRTITGLGLKEVIFACGGLWLY